MNKITISFCLLLVFCFTDCKNKPENPTNAQKAALTDQQGDNIEQEDVVYFLDDSVVSYVDRKYKVKVDYPRAFTELDTSTVGTTLFYYPNKQAPNVVLRLFISESKKEWEEVAAVRSATEAFLKKETASYYLFSGSGWWYNQNLMMEKVYKVDGKWIDLTMYYTELGMPKRVGIMDDWTPFDNMKRHRVAKPVINNMTITDKEAGRRQVSFETESELDYNDCIEVDVQDLRKMFRSKSYKKRLLFSKDMGDTKQRDFYIMNTGSGIAFLVHDNWNGNVRSLVYESRKKNKECKPREGVYPNISGFSSPDSTYFFAVYANQRNGRQSAPYEYDIYMIDAKTLNARYITACGTCYLDKKGFTVMTGKEDPNSKWGANLVRYETYDFNGHRVSVSKYIPEEKFWENFKHKDNTNLKFF